MKNYIWESMKNAERRCMVKKSVYEALEHNFFSWMYSLCNRFRWYYIERDMKSSLGNLVVWMHEESKVVPSWLPGQYIWESLFSCGLKHLTRGAGSNRLSVIWKSIFGVWLWKLIWNLSPKTHAPCCFETMKEAKWGKTRWAGRGRLPGAVIDTYTTFGHHLLGLFWWTIRDYSSFW